MLLYHGTSSIYLDNILEAGLLPRKLTGMKGNYDHTVDGHPNRVYLTNAYAPYYAGAALSGSDDILNDEPVVIVVNTDRCGFLLCDEDALEQVDRHQSKLRGATMTKEELWKRTAMFRDEALDYQAQGWFTWEMSLKALGTCAHMGAIPPEAIEGYVRLKRTTWTVWDPSIVLMNYFIKGVYYRHCSEYLWLGKSSEELRTFDTLGRSESQLHKLIDDMIVSKQIFRRESLSHAAI